MAKQEYHTGGRARMKAYLMALGNRSASVSDIKAHMDAENCPVNVTTIYRYLDKLEAEGNVIKYAADEQGKATYQYVGREHRCDEHLHLKCVNCGYVEHLDCHFMEEISGHIAKEHGFSLQCKNSVIYGLCRKCREAPCDKKDERRDR